MYTYIYVCMSLNDFQVEIHQLRITDYYIYIYVCMYTYIYVCMSLNDFEVDNLNVIYRLYAD